MFWLIVIATFFFMEFVAWFTHKYVMHGFLWTLHKDHHVKTPQQQKSFFERNDSFFVIFAVPGSSFIILGTTIASVSFLFPIGVGITLYGLAYFLMHDIFIHQRIRFLRNSNNAYLKAARRAHKMHHKHITKEDGECFGMLFFPWKYMKKELQSD